MTRCCRYIKMVFVLLFGSIGIAAAQTGNSLQLDQDRLVLQLDLNSPAQKLDSILRLAGINGAATNKIAKGDFSALSKDGWNTGERKGNMVTFDRSLSDLNLNPQNRPFDITANLPEFDGNGGYPANVRYGVNRYYKATVIELASGFTRFILPGHQWAKRAFLSGNFNSWSTLKGVMKKIDGGWVLDVKLGPGAYEYKYIVDGRWMTDPNNRQQVDDDIGNTNSLYFKYNYTIKLAGHLSAGKVVFSGDFNSWNGDELLMDKKATGWEKRLYLGEGQYAYQFLIDGRGVTDPANAEKQDGGIKSVLNVGQPATFRLPGHKNARKVFVSGDFNDWKPDRNAMEKTVDGWKLNMVLPAGNYQYKFVVDGDWITDPANRNFAVEKGETNSLIAIKPNHTFTLKGHGSAKIVRLAGTFNNWDETGYTMTHSGDVWTISLYLKPGKYLYKFKVDDQWIIDPGNKLWEENEHGNGNSVLWME